ncbi:MAG: hypothetical protein IJ002_01805 [Clostridia bacterium]|nr:hypothetical protein [Clostridia bacterium]
MRKLSFALCILMLISCFCFSAFALENDSTLFWSDETTATTSGYPRMAQLPDGTLLMTSDASGTMFYSTDNGVTWATYSKPSSYAKTTVDLTAMTVHTYKTALGYRYESTTTSDENEHALLRSNFQPFVCPDGTVLVAYRSNTKTYTSTYYSSIRVVTSDDFGKTFENEKILIENATTMSGEGFWEPFMIQIDEKTVALYYADDFNVDNNINSDAYQRIAYFTYTVGDDGDWSKGTWSTEYATAIYRTNIYTRDGMPMVTRLSDGSFAMVVETHDYTSSNSDYNCIFVIGLSLSKDGKTWTTPVPVVAPTNLNEGAACAAPSITTLPDGRVVISYQTDDGYTGSFGNISTSDSGNADTYGRVFGAVISNTPITYSTTLTATKGGAADGFTVLDTPFESVTDGYQIWNAVSCFGDDLYLYGTAGTVTAIASDGSTTRTGGKIRIRPAKVYSSAEALASYNAAVKRAGDASYEYIVASPAIGTTTVTITKPVTLSSATEFYVYELDGDFVTLKAASSGSDVSFTADGTANYMVTSAPIVTYGDANADGNVSLSDIIKIVKYIATDTVVDDIAACDISGNKKVELNDLLLAVKEIVK